MDPNRYKHPGLLLGEIRGAIEPALAAKGFRLDARNREPIRGKLYIDYSRPGELFRIAWDAQFGGLIAEMIDGQGNFRAISGVPFSEVRGLSGLALSNAISSLGARLAGDVIAFVRELPPSGEAPAQ